jgi:hypothetical protein
MPDVLKIGRFPSVHVYFDIPMTMLMTSLSFAKCAHWASINGHQLNVKGSWNLWLCEEALRSMPTRSLLVVAAKSCWN